MKSRNYTKRIEFYQTAAVADGYGGNTVSETLVATSWANIRTPKDSQRLIDLGVTDPTDVIIITTRHRNDIDYNAINQFIKYRSVDYVVKNAPTNMGFMDVEVEIIATRQATESVDIL